jgi:molybdopterin/thiamine biosynthesis adenylyltransferase
VVPGQIGLVQATEVLKIILKIGTPMIGKFFYYGALEPSYNIMKFQKNPLCPLCGENPTIKGLNGEDTEPCQASPVFDL